MGDRDSELAEGGTRSRGRGRPLSGNCSGTRSAAKGERWGRRGLGGARAPRTWQAPPTPNAGASATGRPGLRGRSPRRATRDSSHRSAGSPGLSSRLSVEFQLRLPEAGADPAALPHVPDPALHLPPPPTPNGLPSLPWRRPRPAPLLRRPTVRGLWTPGAQPAEGHRERTRPAPSAGRGAQQGGATRTGTAGLELCPSPRQSAGTGLAPGWRPRLPPRGQAARGRGLLASGRDQLAQPLGRVRGADGRETTIPGRSRAGAAETAGRVGLRSSPMCGAAREPAVLQNRSRRMMML